MKKKKKTIKKNSKKNIVFFNNYRIKPYNMSVVEFLKSIFAEVKVIEQEKEIIDNRFYFYIFDFIYLPIIDDFKKEETIFKNQKKIIGIYAKGKTIKKFILSKKADVVEKLNVYEVCPHEFVYLYDYSPKLVDFFYEIYKVKLFKEGVKFNSFNNIFIDFSVKIEKGAEINQNVIIEGDTLIESGAIISSFTYINKAKIGKNTIVKPFTHIQEAILEEGVEVGPYTRLRKGTVIKEKAKVGNFVEMKKSLFGKGSKAMHLSYVGDATVGKKVNIGAGTITCNYDGQRKYKTLIENDVFIGSGTELVAPVKVEKGAYVAAGSTITKEVPKYSLGIARNRQRNIENWVKRKKLKRKK